MENNPLQEIVTRFPPLLTRIDNNDNLLEVMNNSINNNLLESQKQNIKELKIKPVEKTQRIKKDKKVEKKSIPKEEITNKNDVDQFQAEIIDSSVDRLRLYLQNPDTSGVSKYRGMDEQSLLQFLQLIELQYSETAAIYLEKNINKNMCGNLKSVLSRFVNQIIASFPVLQKLVYYMAVEHYNSGRQQHRFDKLMNKNITPIIHVKSENYLKVECSEWYLKSHASEVKQETDRIKEQDSVEADHEDELDPSFESQGDTLKVDKKKRKNKKKKEKKEKKEDVEEPLERQQKKDESLEEMTKFLESMNIKQQDRVECRIDEQLLQHWRDRIYKLSKSVQKIEK